MKTTLVGYTGFVGGNLAREHDFDRLYNSKNIGEAFETEQGLVVYSGVRAEKFLANSDPDGDRKIFENAIDNIRRMKPEKLV
ncbi:MAG: NAD(P)-dependent oxidoreductase, partial [Oscillospiraceae bacterium]